MSGAEPNGSNFDRIQIIKIWLGGGSMVNVKDVSYTNTIGNAVLSGYWVLGEPDVVCLVRTPS